MRGSTLRNSASMAAASLGFLRTHCCDSHSAATASFILVGLAAAHLSLIRKRPPPWTYLAETHQDLALAGHLFLGQRQEGFEPDHRVDSALDQHLAHVAVVRVDAVDGVARQASLLDELVQALRRCGALRNGDASCP